MNRVLKCLCVFQCLILSYFLIRSGFLNESTLSSVWLSGCVLKYLYYVLIFVSIGADVSPCSFEYEMRLLDQQLNVDVANVLRMKIIAGVFILLNRIFTFLFYSYTNYRTLEPIVPKLTYLSIVLCQEYVHMENVFLFISIHYRLKRYVSSLRNVNVIDNCQFLYQRIVGVAEKFKKTYDPVFLGSIVLNVPQVMLSIYQLVWQMKHETIRNLGLGLFLLDKFLVIVALIGTLAPAIVAGLLPIQTNKIKVILNDRLMLENDESTCYKIERFIRYVEARPLKFTVYEVIPLDATLLGIVVNFCITYLIVMIQFTNLY